ncbi:MAG: hypothetical protein EZS26_001581 [Candidatus Ordinivivax streblomastigis]|uniref:BIG2 domain-containing protein n=1 Tax=Candidatus Ordinivivax streblomastigis TaxID=2540710 RepID=A0A5M8P1C8_9BACT|nr:MAG: hypothetical protein EZS26_001581 [Candidatus Ordinivivax streblomastigis]
MKTRSFFTLAMCMAFAVVGWSCGDSEESSTTVEVSGITLDKETASVEIESTVVFKAILEPKDAKGEIKWNSSNSAVAVVNQGVVTGISAGKATIAATCGAYSATCAVTVISKAVDASKYPSLQGSNYYVIQLGESARAAIAGKMVIDLGPDDVNKFNYVWPDSGNSFVGGPAPDGQNCYGQYEGWISYMVGALGWSGGGYTISAGFGNIDMTDLFNHVNDYVFHIALKAKHDKPFMFTFNDETAEAKLVIGSTPFDDNGKSYQPYTNFTRNGEWHEIEIPVSALNALGVFYRNPFQNKTVFAYLAGGAAGTTLEYDAVFFYKPQK